MNLTEKDKEIIKKCLDEGKPIPSIYKQKLFKTEDAEFVEATKDYKLVYKGKARKEDIIANTPAAPFQKIRSFNSDNKFEDEWSNMLIFGDNLLALKAIYEDQQGANIYKTKNKIKLIYIDPPFATKQDFMKDREKAYRDKIIGAQFIEFLRKRLIMLREILADNGSIYVHLDWKKGHYIKAIMDEIFGEHNFRNEIAWCYSGPSQSENFFPRKHDYIFLYKCTDQEPIFKPQYTKHKSGLHNTGQVFGNMDSENKDAIKELVEKGKKIEDWWVDVWATERYRKELIDYPTQKPEKLLERIIHASSNEEDIILDCFAGSGTTLTTSEKLNRRWIGMDCGKLAIYTIQKRMLNLTTQIGSFNKDDRRDYERVADFEQHSKANSRGLFFIYEKARRGDLVITDSFLINLGEFISSNLSGNKKEEFSLICPEEKLKLQRLKPFENEESKVGEKFVDVGKVRFLISFVQPKEITEKEKQLQAKEFTLYHAGVYDAKAILNLEWEQYKPFVAQLFGVRISEHKVHSLKVDGYIGVNSAYIWDYPNQKELLLDEEYVKTLHEALGGRAGDKFYVVAPISSLSFMQDEISYGSTTYVFLKVPLSVLMALINKGEPGALKQPASETDVNEVMDAIGFDFISQPQVVANFKRATPDNQDLFNASDKDYIIEITEFKSNTLAYDPEDFINFETFSMVMVDTNYNEEYFHLNEVFWADKVWDYEKKKAIVRIPEKSFSGDKMMIIFMDKYGNELKVIRTKKDFL